VDSTGQRNTLINEVTRECWWPAGDSGGGAA
jgi:hypothetical protein